MFFGHCSSFRTSTKRRLRLAGMAGNISHRQPAAGSTEDIDSPTLSIAATTEPSRDYTWLQLHTSASARLTSICDPTASQASSPRMTIISLRVKHASPAPQALQALINTIISGVSNRARRCFSAVMMLQTYQWRQGPQQ